MFVMMWWLSVFGCSWQEHTEIHTHTCAQRQIAVQRKQRNDSKIHPRSSWVPVFFFQLNFSISRTTGARDAPLLAVLWIDSGESQVRENQKPSNMPLFLVRCRRYHFGTDPLFALLGSAVPVRLGGVSCAALSRRSRKRHLHRTSLPQRGWIVFLCFLLFTVKRLFHAAFFTLHHLSASTHAGSWSCGDALRASVIGKGISKRYLWDRCASCLWMKRTLSSSSTDRQKCSWDEWL